MDLAVYIYYFLDLFLPVYCSELNIKEQMERKIEEQSFVDTTSVYGSLSLVEEQPIIEHYISNDEIFSIEEANLDPESEQFFRELQDSISLMEDNQLQDEYTDTYWMVFTNDYENEPSDNQETLQIKDLDERLDNSKSSGYEMLASAKIADCIEGPQQWVVQIIGKEGHFIHVLDGSKRTWIDIGPRANKLHTNDVIMLDITRYGKEIEVDKVIRLETDVSEDYLIPDEDCYQEANTSDAIAI